jgi:hypothetical protein
MENVVLMLCPGAEPLSWAEFCESHPPFSIALDGYVAAGSRYSSDGPWLNLDHHADVDRLATRATCSQVLMCIRQGLFDAFRDVDGPRAQVYVNDCDEDVCLSWFLLQNPQAGCLPSNTRLDRLIHAVDLLDTTAGASVHPLDVPLMSEIAWIFEPYRLAKLQGVLDRPFASLHRLVIDAVGQRIRAHLADKGQALPLDTRYERIGGGRGWALVREIGPQSRVGMIADGIRAYVSARQLADGAWSYSIGRVSPFVPFDVPAILSELNAAEDYQRGTWGGGNLVGGSPRLHGSAIPPHEITRIVNRVVGRVIPALVRAQREPLPSSVLVG